MRMNEVHLAPGEIGKCEISCWERLANAVIAQACRDYANAIKAENKHQIASLERLFRSEWCAMLTKLDTEWLMQQIKNNGTRKRCWYFGRKH